MDLETLLHKPAFLQLSPDGSGSGIHGQIYRAAQGDSGKRLTRYSLTLRPQLAYLAHRINQRIFQNLSVPKIIIDPILEIEIKYPAGVLQLEDGSSYMFRIALERSSREADNSKNAFSGEINEGIILSKKNNQTIKTLHAQLKYKASNCMPTPKASLELPPQLKWTFANEPKILEWSIKARNYNTKVANSLFTIMLFATFGLSLFLYSAYHDLDQVWRISACATFFILTTLTASLMTHQKMNFAYRLTNTGIEYCKWKTLPKLTKKSLMYLATITTIILIFLAIIDPYLLVGALVGPGGMGLTYLLMLNSKNHNEMHTQHHHYAYKWGEITQVAIATNREVIDLQYSVIQEGDTHTTNWNLNVFCIKNEKNSIAKIIKSHLSTNIPFINAKVNVPMSTD